MHHQNPTRGSIWLRAEHSGHGPTPGHDRPQIAAAAVSLADANGLAAVSMRKVGASIGAGAASLYRYVDGRDELLELMVDSVLGRTDLSRQPSGDCVADLVALAHELRRTYRRHPWMATEIAVPSLLGPRAVDLLEYGMRLLRPLDIEAATKLDALAVLIGQVTLVVQTEAAGSSEPTRWQNTNASHLARMIDPLRHPNLGTALATTAHTPAAAGDPLDRLLPRLLSGLLGVEPFRPTG